LLDSKAAVRFPSDATRVDAIECLGGGLTFDEICIAQNALQGHDRPWRQGNESDALINDDERGLHADCEDWLEELAPDEPISRYRHNRTGEDNGDAHLKRQVMGREVVVAVTDGRFDFGPWEQIFYGEFDGRRRKRVLVKIIGE
jgi:secondary thiamine-phosphate synthase enzyme